MIKYIVTLLKRARNIFPAIFFITVLLLSVMLFVGNSVLTSYNNSEGKTKIRIGIVGDTSETYMDIGFSAVRHLDASRFSVDLIEKSEEEAQRDVLSGDMLGYVKIPDDFIENMSYGKECRLEYYMRNDSSSFGAIITKEIVTLDSELVLQAQGTVFTAGDIARKAKYGNEGSFMDELALKYITAVLNRSEMIETDILGISEHLSIGGYYFCGATVLFLLLWGISCCELLMKDNRGIHKLLCSRNIKSVQQVVCEYAVYLFLTLLMLTAVFAAGAVTVGKSDMGIAELSGINVADAIGFLFKNVPVVIMFTAFQMLVYECADDRVSVITFQVIFTVIFCYISGCFYPSSFFPEILQGIASVLPVGVGFSYLKETLFSQASVLTALLVLLYSTVFLSATAVIRKFKTAGDGQ